MCVWCDPDFEMPVHPTKELHDMWLFPHGRHGYTSPEKIAASQALCRWCANNTFSGVVVLPDEGGEPV